MRVLVGDQFLVRIFVGESDKHHHAPLHRALLERLRAEGFAGATVFHGIAGFGARSVVATARASRSSASRFSAPRARRSNSAYAALASATMTAVATVMRVATFTPPA